MAVLDDERDAIQSLELRAPVVGRDDERLDAYYEGSARLERLGIAVPPELELFETAVNWPRLVCDSVEERCDVKSLMLPGEDVADPGLREAWDVNDLDSEAHLAQLDSLVYGRGFISVGTNEDNKEHPIIAVESPKEITLDIDWRRRRVNAALKLYGKENGDGLPGQAKYATLYTADATVWAERINGQWVQYDRDDHGVGRCPITPLFNRRRTGRFTGVSEMADAIPMTDAAARRLTGLEVAAEVHAVPQRYLLGASKGDFVDENGNPLPTWQAYFGAIWGSENPDAKAGQFSASDLRNFHETVMFYGQLIAGMYGLPMRYLGQNTANPPSADGIRADEARLVKRAERKMSSWGDAYGRVAALYLRFRNGEWSDPGNRIKVEWHDAATPTYAAKVDGIQKLTGGKPILSQEGGWDELGWSETRKDRERDYFAREASDPLIEQIAKNLTGPAEDVPGRGD